jgi:hypothetical protein
MKSVAEAAVAMAVAPGIDEMLAKLWSQVSARFYRFLNNLPKRAEDVDPEVFKRVPVPT